MTGITFDMAQVLWRLILFHYLGNIDPGGWMASIASMTTALAFLGGLDLRLISGGRGIVGFSLVFVFGCLIAGLSVGVLLVFFRRRVMAFQVPGVDFPNIEGWL